MGQPLDVSIDNCDCDATTALGTRGRIQGLNSPRRSDVAFTPVGTTSDGGLRARAATVAHEIEGVHDVDNRIISVPSRGRF